VDLGLRDRCVLVTGASGKIGRATATAFGAEGARVAVAYHSQEEQARETARGIRAAGGVASVIPLDLGEESSIVEAVTNVERELGDIDVLVNNAVAWPGRGPVGERFEQAPLARLRASIEANLIGHYALSQRVIGSMRARGWGRIVHISTGLVQDGLPGSSSYTTPKSALHGLTRTMSRELAPAGILTNAVLAGYIPRPDTSAELLERASRSAAIGRPSDPPEIANLIVFLSSAANTNITGELIRADGHFLTGS
jgi:3-oxoacyl-[acyl-carrier protein] reductase